MRRVAVTLFAAVLAILLLLPAFAFVVLLLVVAATARGLARLVEPRFVPWTELMSFDPGLGWKPRANLDTYYLADQDDVFRVVTDGDGWPGRRTVEESDVLVIGDSFAFGYGVDWQDSFAESQSELRVKAIGAPGYSMVHGVRLMERLGERIRGKLVVWFIYPENDLQDNLFPEMRRYRAPFVRLNAGTGIWTIVDRHITPERWQCSDLDRRRLFPFMCVPGPVANRAYSACKYLLERAVHTCRLSGATLAVFTIPHPSQLTVSGRAQLAAASGQPEECDARLPDLRLAACCLALGLPFVSGQDHLTRSDYKRREGIHWNVRGHRRVAMVLRDIAVRISSGTSAELQSALASHPGKSIAMAPSQWASGGTGSAVQ